MVASKTFYFVLLQKKLCFISWTNLSIVAFILLSKLPKGIEWPWAKILIPIFISNFQIWDNITHHHQLTCLYVFICTLGVSFSLRMNVFRLATYIHYNVLSLHYATHKGVWLTDISDNKIHFHEMIAIIICYTILPTHKLSHLKRCHFKTNQSMVQYIFKPILNFSLRRGICVVMLICLMKPLGQKIFAMLFWLITHYIDKILF